MVIESTDNSPPRKIKGVEPVKETKKSYQKKLVQKNALLEFNSENDYLKIIILKHRTA